MYEEDPSDEESQKLIQKLLKDNKKLKRDVHLLSTALKNQLHHDMHKVSK